ncbi:MAG: methyltransferase domain-containing protein [Rhodobacterales bacterium]|nr:methyltransferase domain-containing protein [Rhodobacterales bacterium]
MGARPWYAQIHETWLANLPYESEQDGLEVGCGPGSLTRHVQALGLQMTGLDRSPKMVSRARSSVPKCTFVQGDALALPQDNNRFDLAFAASVVNVVAQPEQLVREMARVVRPGVRVSVLFPTPRLAQHSHKLIAQLGLVTLSAAALTTWAAKAPKREPSAIAALFEAQGLVDLHVDEYFYSTVASVTGKVP